jgi:hypothetical protein
MFMSSDLTRLLWSILLSKSFSAWAAEEVPKMQLVSAPDSALYPSKQRRSTVPVLPVDINLVRPDQQLDHCLMPKV